MNEVKGFEERRHSKALGTRTRYCRDNPSFDRMLGNLTISGLRAFINRYEKDIDYMTRHDAPEDELMLKIKRLKAAENEYSQRKRCIDSSITYLTKTTAGSTYHSIGAKHFDSQKGLIYESYNPEPIGTVAFNEDETGVIVRDGDCNQVGTEIKVNADRDIKDKYKDWKYWKDED